MKNLPKALVGVHFIHWIATYPLDKVIRSLNNRGLAYKPLRNKRKKAVMIVFGSAEPLFMPGSGVKNG